MRNYEIGKLRKHLGQLATGIDLDALRAVARGEGWRVPPADLEAMQSMIVSAQSRVDDETKAMQAECLPLSQLPDALILLSLHVGGQEQEGCCQYKILGYRRAVDGKARHYYKGEYVYCSGMAAILAALYRKGNADGISIITIYDSQADYEAEHNGTTVSAMEFERRWEEDIYWQAIVSGNAVSATASIQDIYPGAIAIAPNIVSIAPCTDIDKETTHGQS